MGTRTPDIKESEFAEVKDQTAEPPMFQVLIHNDDFTTKAFVIEILTALFNKSLEEATRIMWHTHQNGTGLCGIYPFEVAETKVATATDAARANGFPLRLTIEEA